MVTPWKRHPRGIWRLTTVHHQIIVCGGNWTIRDSPGRCLAEGRARNVATAEQAALDHAETLPPIMPISLTMIRVEIAEVAKTLGRCTNRVIARAAIARLTEIDTALVELGAATTMTPGGCRATSD